MIENDFKVFRIKNLENYHPSFGRKDLYRICLVIGKNKINYNDRSILISGKFLFFGNINIPYSWEIESNEQQGYSCLFTNDFLKGTEFQNNTTELSPFHSTNNPVYLLEDKKSFANIEFIFKRMLTIYNGNYTNKRYMIKTLINLLIHEAIIINLASTNNQKNYNNEGNSRQISLLFQNLLDKQFPVENKNIPIKMTTAFDFAKELSIHPNYLNRIIKRDTGKTLLKHINERVITEAKVLLEHTSWTISEISFCLGFEYHSYFDNLFKRITGITPKNYRKSFLNNF